MSYPRCLRYKNSGLTWLGDVPEHWHVTPLKYVASLKGRLGWQGLRSDEYTEDGPYLVTSEHFVNEGIDWPRCYHVTPERYAMAPEIQLRPDDVLIMKDGPAMGKLAYVDSVPGPACLNSHLLLLRPINGQFRNRFLYYVLGCPAFKTYMEQERTGTTFFGISQESIGSFALVLPPVWEQERTLRVLDRETSKIDALIFEQQRLIALLQEKRQSLISHAVTKGLNLAAPMADSGMESVGQIPKHWKVKRIKRISPAITVGIVVEPSKYYCESGLPALRSLNVRPGAISTENLVCISNEANKLLAKSQVRTGDLVIVRSGQPGTAAVVPGSLDGCNCIDLIIIRKSITVLGEYLCHYLNSDAAIRQFSEGSAGAIQQHFNISTAMNLVVPVPPIDEQRAILASLDAQTSRLDALIFESQRATALLQERRTALISAAVTGKIDVRSAASGATA